VRWIIILIASLAIIGFCVVTSAEESKTKEDYRLLRFRAPWCGPCHKQKKVFDEAKIAEELKKHGVKDFFLDVDKHQDIVKLWKVETIPTTLLVRVRVKNKATAVKRWGGRDVPLMTAEQYKQFVDPTKEGPSPPKKE